VLLSFFCSFYLALLLFALCEGLVFSVPLPFFLSPLLFFAADVFPLYTLLLFFGVAIQFMFLFL